MKNFEMDLSDVYKVVNPDNSRIPVKGNEHRIVRVAFDLFRVRDERSEDLWQVQADDDGNEYLVRTYSLPEEDDKLLVSSDWEVQEDSKQANLTVSYKGCPIERVATKDFGANTPQESYILKNALMKKLATDKEFVNKFVSSLSIVKRNLLKEAGMNDINEHTESKGFDPKLSALKLEQKLQEKSGGNK